MEKLLNSIYSDTDVPCQWLSITITSSVVVVVCSGLTSLSTIFQLYHDGFWLRQGAQCSLKYHAPDT